MSSKLPVLFISHGGGPWPWIEDMRDLYQVTSQELAALGKRIRPKAILSISGHWEEHQFSVSTSRHPPMVYDYSGFPPHTYQIKYDAPGSPELALQVKSLLAMGGMHVEEDPSQGFDHGTFVPLYLMYPEAQIPVVQFSLKSTLDPFEHYKAGTLLAPLRDAGVLILASGLSYHNLRFFFRGGAAVAATFEAWLTETVESAAPLRKEKLLNWERAPEARAAHPREDHLIPLMVAAGAAGMDQGKRIILDRAFDIAMASYQFGD